jgi:hypothetical protein
MEAAFYARWIMNSVCTKGGEPIGFIKVLRDETLRQDPKDEEQRRSQFAWDLIEQQARLTSSALAEHIPNLWTLGAGSSTYKKQNGGALPEICMIILLSSSPC